MATCVSYEYILGEDFGFEISNEDGSNITATTTGTMYIRKNNLDGEVVMTKVMTPAVDLSNIFVKVTPEEAETNLSEGNFVCIFVVIDGTTTRDIEHIGIELGANGMPVA